MSELTDQFEFGNRLPLPFEDWGPYRRFQEELAELLAALESARPLTALVHVAGSPSTFYAANPRQPLGHHFDGRGPRTTNLELELHSPEMAAALLAENGSTGNRRVLGDGRQVFFRNHGPAGFDQEFPEFAALARRWSEALGREVAIRLKIDLEPVSQVARPQPGEPIEVLRRE
jgi:hypothetical protein